jgi:TolA-binding protein
MLNFVETQLTNWLVGEDENNRSETIRTLLLKSINKYPDNKSYSSLMIWFSMQKRDFASALKQAKAMDKRYNEDGRRIFELSNIAAENHDFSTAIDGYNYILSRGETTIFYYDAQMMLLSIKLIQSTMTYPVNHQQVLAIDRELTQYFQSREMNNANFGVYRRWISLKAVQLNDIETAKEMLNRNLQSNNIAAKEKAILKLDLGDILQLEKDVWEATLLYSQVEKDFPNDTIGHVAKFKNAKLSFHIGEFEWAKAQLDVLRAATTKLIANDAMYFSLLISDNQNEDDSLNIPLKQFANADFLMSIHRYDEALNVMETIENQNINHSLLDDILYKKAKIALIQQDYAKADKLYEMLVKNYPSDLLADDALFERAQLQATHFKDNFKAMELYQQLLLDYPDSIYTIEARERFRVLRGDNIHGN